MENPTSFYETGDIKPGDAETALALVYGYASQSYIIYSLLAEDSDTFGHEDKLRFKGVAAASAETVKIIRDAHPATAEKVDSFRRAANRPVVPVFERRIPGEVHLCVDHEADEMPEPAP
jgi:hypothetical protein